MTGFKQYGLPATIDSNGKPISIPVKAKDKRAYAQALGHATDNPGISDYALAVYLRKTVCPDVGHKALEKRIERWRDSQHWRANIPPHK
jgi:hypothetical protein